MSRPGYGYSNGHHEHRDIIPETLQPASDVMQSLKPAWSFGCEREPSNVTKEVIRQIVQRDAHGQRKYGVTMDRGDLTLSQWLQHMAEELMDGAHYALAAKRERDQFEQEVAQIVNAAQERARRDALGFSGSDAEMAWNDGVRALVVAIQQELNLDERTR